MLIIYPLRSRSPTADVLRILTAKILIFQHVGSYNKTLKRNHFLFLRITNELSLRRNPISSSRKRPPFVYKLKWESKKEIYDILLCFCFSLSCSPFEQLFPQFVSVGYGRFSLPLLHMRKFSGKTMLCYYFGKCGYTYIYCL